jgi:hypothetical protein
MYKMTTIDGTKEFWFKRPNGDLNKVLNEFTKDLHECITKQREQTKHTFLKTLFDLITLCQDPTKNYYKIEEMLLADFGTLSYYFHFSKSQIPETNELVKAIPELFESPEYYFTFLNGIKIHVTWLLHQPHSKMKPSQNTKPLSIAYAIWFLRNGTGLTETQTIKETVTDFLQKYEGKHSTIVSYVSDVSKFTSTDHNQKKQLIKAALRLLDDYPNGRAGRDWWSNNKTRLLGEK